MTVTRENITFSIWLLPRRSGESLDLLFLYNLPDESLFRQTRRWKALLRYQRQG